jgi:hypothetical protein
MAARAVRCFRAQTYENKRMLVWDSSTDLTMCDQLEKQNVVWVPAEPQSIGALRNSANGFWTEFDIICHFDDDDWSHPRRIEEQVEALEASGKDAVGLNELIFWKTEGLGEAWLYRLPLPGYALGTSLMYWRRSWLANPFPDKSDGEDFAFLRHVSCKSESGWPRNELTSIEPRMVAVVHGGNTCTKIDQSKSEWTRRPDMDTRVRAILEAA